MIVSSFHAIHFKIHFIHVSLTIVSSNFSLARAHHINKHLAKSLELQVKAFVVWTCKESGCYPSVACAAEVKFLVNLRSPGTSNICNNFVQFPNFKHQQIAYSTIFWNFFGPNCSTENRVILVD